MTENVAQTTERLMSRIQHLEKVIEDLEGNKIQSELCREKNDKEILVRYILDQAGCPRPMFEPIEENEGFKKLPIEIKTILLRMRDQYA